MAHTFFALFTLLAAFNGIKQYSCIDLQKMNENETSQLLSQLDLPPNIFAVRQKLEVNIMKNWIMIVPPRSSKIFYTLRYNKHNAVLDAQFAFHRSLSQKVGNGPFFTYASHCFTDAQWNYLVHVQEGTRKYLFPQVQLFAPQRFSQVLGSLVRLFRNFEAQRAVFVDKLPLTLQLSASGEVQLRPPELGFVYEAASRSYVRKELWFARGGVTGPYVDDSASNGYCAMTTITVWNRYFCLRAVEDYVTKRLGARLPPAERDDLLTFLAQTRALREDVTDSQVSVLQWAELEEFVDSLGQQGTLARRLRVCAGRWWGPAPRSDLLAPLWISIIFRCRSFRKFWKS